MKKVLYYAIKLGGLYGPRVVAVTTERGGRWWGRDLRDNLGTSGRMVDIHGRFLDEASAKAKIEQVDRVANHFRRQHRELDAAYRELNFAQEQMILQVIDEAPRRGARMLQLEIVRKTLDDNQLVS